jgi:Spx/MgsR family transcriptional regulator
MTIEVYGIKNCDTMKKTFQFLEEKGLAYTFVDYKKNAPSRALLRRFLEKIPLDELVNRRGTTYRKLSDEEKALTQQVETAVAVLSDRSSMIKRPIIVFPDGEIVAGFDSAAIVAKVSAG